MGPVHTFGSFADIRSGGDYVRRELGTAIEARRINVGKSANSGHPGIRGVSGSL
jgi:hypothetical protein